MTVRNMGICIWWRNKTQDVCVERCQEEGRYRYLEPQPLPAWEQPPQLPVFRELVDITAGERLALVYLSAHYRGTR